MIKITNEKIFITFGEGCYFARLRNGSLECLHFGRRLEPEDDAAYLVGETKTDEFTLDAGMSGDVVADGDFTPNTVVDVDTGKHIAVDLKFAGASTIEKPEFDTISLRGDKTLEAELKDDGAGLTVKLYYTPYSRGGIMRRSVVTNTSGKTYRFRATSARFFVNGKNTVVFPTGNNTTELNYIALGDRRTSGKLGEAYGALTLCGSDAIMAAEENGDITTVYVEEDNDITLRSGESAVTPETLLAYSDNGIDGVYRIMHDIIRENGMSTEFNARRPIVYYQGNAADMIEERVNAAAEIGVDTLAVDFPEISPAALELYEKTCENRGLTLGIRAEISDEKDVDKLVEISKRFGVGYIEIDPASPVSSVALKRIREEISGAETELSHSDKTPSALKGMLPIPPCVTRNVVRSSGKTSLKTKFDAASFGALGYELDLLSEPQNIRFAIRAQIMSYLDDRDTVMNGDLYTVDGGLMAVAKNKSEAYVVTGAERVTLYGLDAGDLYSVREIGKTFSGAALMSIGLSTAAKKGETVSFHLRQVADYE